MYFPCSMKANATKISNTVTLLGKRTDSEEKNQLNKKTKQEKPKDGKRNIFKYVIVILGWWVKGIPC